MPDHRPVRTAVARAPVSRDPRDLGAERVLHDLSAAAPGAARRRPPGAGAAGSGGERHLDPAAATLPERPGVWAHGWKLGPNHGPRPGAERRCRTAWRAGRRHGRKVSLIGWSLGGVFAREMARRAPDHVRCVITLGSPFAGAPKASNAWKLYERASQRRSRTGPGASG